jgi:enoyl-CoA hydratase/carnithine racemase
MPSLRIDTNAGVRTIVLASGALQHDHPELRDELDAALDSAESDRDVRVVLLRAEGSAFCAGSARLVDGRSERAGAADGRLGFHRRPA